jgi:HSP20 family protein
MKLTHTTNSNWLPSLIDEMFKNDYSGGTAQIEKRFIPAVNVYELEDKFHLEMIIPGFKKKDVSIEVDKDLLNISSGIELKNEP